MYERQLQLPLHVACADWCSECLARIYDAMLTHFAAPQPQVTSLHVHTFCRKSMVKGKNTGEEEERVEQCEPVAVRMQRKRWPVGAQLLTIEITSTFYRGNHQCHHGNGQVQRKRAAHCQYYT